MLSEEAYSGSQEKGEFDVVRKSVSYNVFISSLYSLSQLVKPQFLRNWDKYFFLIYFSPKT